MGTERRLVCRVQALLARLEDDADLQRTLQTVLGVISAASGCESVGIRWKAEEDYPYFVTRGFGIEFVVREGPLCDRDSGGLIVRHGDGTPQLACMCGAVIQGRIDGAQSYFTEGGSFWTNGTTALLRESPPKESWGLKTRNYCNAVGYESVALVPMRRDEETYGLLQLNSRTPKRFTRHQIELYERVAGEMARAIAGQRER